MRPESPANVMPGTPEWIAFWRDVDDDIILSVRPNGRATTLANHSIRLTRFGRTCSSTN